MKKRKTKVAIGGVLAAALALALAGYLGRDRIIDAAIRRQLTDRTDHAYTENNGRIRVLLCGTGSPELSEARAQACTLVAAGGKIFLFDAGEGATKSLAQSNVPLRDLTRVFITHFHSDHYNGLATLVNETWIWGRQEPMTVSGPVGTDKVIGGLNEAYDLDNGYRAEHMPDLEAHRAAARAVPAEITFPDGAESVRVYDEGGVTIDARLVDHEPVEPALGYVVTYRGKKVFISGDTMVTARNLPAMQDADLVVHEAYASHLVRRALPIMREMGQTHDADVAEHTIPYHADTLALAEQAQQAGVKHLVLTHLTPYPANALSRRLFVSGMSDRYHGELTLGRDGMLLEL